MVGGRGVAFSPPFREAVLSLRAHSAKLVACPVGRLQGRVRAPGDKSVSHRALMFGALALGETTVRGLLEGEDVLATAAALRLLGAEVTHERDAGPMSGGLWRVRGFGVGGGREPADVLELGNSGTSARLLAGILASHPFTSVMTGDASLRRRPMQRVIEPLTRMGARFEGREGGRLPLAIVGTDEMVPIEYRLPVASAQVKSAVLLAGLNTAGETTVIEPEPTRDHTERMLRHFGAELRVTPAPGELGGGRRITVVGWPELLARDIVVPGDPSSAAFAVVAAAIRPGSDITVENVGINPLRTGLYQTLRDMGADIAFENEREVGGEPVADLHVKGGVLKGVDVPAERAPAMIDEYPILAIAAACARGTTRMLGLAELRAKESDRLASVSAGLSANGVKHEMGAADLVVHGTGAPPAGGSLVATHLDHRIAMSFLVLGLAAREPVAIDDGAPIDTSFPGFAQLMNGLGARIEAA